MRRRDTGDIVLVVDDSPDTLRMLTDALEDAGMTVLVAIEGAQRLRSSQKSHRTSSSWMP
jgi:DNA-binding response OmpR family regulator